MSEINRGRDGQKIVLRIKFRKPDFAAIGKGLLRAPKTYLTRLMNANLRWRMLAAAMVLVIADVYGSLTPWFQDHAYAIGNGAGLLPQSSAQMASKLSLDLLKQTYNFDPASTTSSANMMGQATYSSATLHQDATKGITVTDPVNKTDFTMVPKFQTMTGRQDNDRVVYPLSNGSGWAVYTLRGDGMKEDIIINHAYSDTMSYDYTLQLGDNLQAKIEKDGSLGIYGNTLLSGNIQTGSDKDAQLLQKARQNAPKTTLLFAIPAPVVLDKHGPANGIKSSYSLSGDTLTVTATGMKKGNYPLAIDPSIYVVSATQFMAGNNETNINFDTDNKLIDKSPVTGARFNQWNSTTDLTTPVWGAGTVPAGGYIYQAGGTTYQAQVFNSQGSSTFTVPSGVTSITVKAWGAGGGSGGGAKTTNGGGTGGGGGAVAATFNVTPGDTLTVYVGGGGGAGTYSATGQGAGGGGGGGGYSSIYDQTTGNKLLALAAGGAGGGGGRQATAGGAGGSGGCTATASTCNGTAGGSTTGGGGGSTSAGGTAGTGTNTGGTGSSLTGGVGADGRNTNSTDGSANNGGLATGGDGGSPNATSTYAGGGGGGSGYYGGGGGGASGAGGTGTQSGSGGGGGSNYIDAGATGSTSYTGSTTSPGNSGDSSRNGAGTGAAKNGAAAAGNTGSNGLVYIGWGTGGTVNTSAINWAQFDTGTGTINSPNPGTGACSGWCTNSAYNLPGPRANLSLVAYNGFLYAIGGTDSGCTAAAGTGTSGYCKTVYVAKLGANGEPRLWSPTSSNPSTWTYWYRSTDLTTERAYSGAVAYNGKLYLIGGRTSTAPVSTVQVAPINGSGTIGSWTATTSFGSNIYGHSVQVYNDRMYVMGGATSVGGAPSNSVYYSKVKSDGTLDTWKQTSSFATGRMTYGGNFSVIWGGYIYVSSGCSAVNASGYCTTTASDAQVASINTDGTLDSWDTMPGVTDGRMSQNLIAWRNNIYEIGGCSAMNTSTGDCNGNILGTINYGTVNQAGDVSTISTSVASGTAPCTGTTGSNCNLPGTTYIGDLQDASLINNGYIYLIGGCTSNTCSTISSNVAYASISSTGVITAPTTCPGGTIRGSMWCVDTTNTVPGGIAFSSAVAFNNTIYLVGGINTGNGNDNTGDIFYASVNNNGSLATGWTTESITGAGAANVSSAYALVRANPSDATNNPANLYIFGGCTNSNSAACTAYTGNVYKCNIASDTSVSGCTTSGQMQIGTIPEDTSAGLAFAAGAYYAGFVYLIGGSSPHQTYLSTVRRARIDNNNNVVAASGSTWVESASTMTVARHLSNAFGYNGYLYVVGGYNSTQGVLSDVQFIKIDVSDGTLDGDPSNGNKFYVSTATVTGRWGHNVLVQGSNAYVIGGCTTGAAPNNCTARTDNIQTLAIYNNDGGSPAGFSTSANTFSTDPNRVGVSAAVLNGYLYVAGGCTSTTSYCTAASGNVSYSAIDSYGNLGTWSNATKILPAHRAWGKLRVAGGSLYYIGGQSDSANDYRPEVYYATPVANGNITSTWGTASNGLPNGRTNFGAAVWNNRLYVVGGQSNSVDCTSGQVCATIYVSPQLNSGGDITSAWSTTSTPFNVPRDGTVAVAYANNLYIFGGYDGTNFLNDTQYTQINTGDGSVGSWSYSSNMPSTITQGDGFAANGYIYVMGGQSGTGVCNPVTYMAPVSANTTIASGNNPTGVGKWFETNQLYTGNRYGNATVYNDGKAYILGGACNIADASYTGGGTYNYNVPTGVTNIIVKAWGGGGGSGGAAGGGGGYTSSTLSVTPGETLSVRVGGGGGAGVSGTNAFGGGGGGYSGVFRSATPLLIAGGGGGGGGTSGNYYGGPGGCTTSGTLCNSNVGGTGAIQSGGGLGGGGYCAGSAGSYLTGGAGGRYLFACTTGGAGTGGANGGGSAGSPYNYFFCYYSGGSGGGGGYYGGGGGGGNSCGDAGGGGGGSDYVTGSGQVETTGFGSTPGNSADSDRGNAGQGGTTSGAAGSDGAVIITTGTVIYASPVAQQTTLLAQPQVAKYSIMFDTDTDVYPTNWLLNGVDNSIGAQWQLKYQSMTDPTHTWSGGTGNACSSSAMSTWGQSTTNTVTLGAVGTYTPLDGSGGNTSCARYYFLNTSVDSSQAFGFPDDVSRGPTITDMTLAFTADPSKRLMHGRTFAGELQMPDDTPYSP